MTPVPSRSRSRSAAGRAILFHDTGELGNRLVSYSYLLAFGAEHRVPVTNLCFWRYGYLFDRPNRFEECAWLDETASDQAPPARGVGEKLLEALLHLPGFAFIRRRFEFDGALVCAPRALVARVLVAVGARCPRLLPRIAARLGFALRAESQWQHRCSLLVPRDLTGMPLTDPALPVKHAAFLRSQFRLAVGRREQLAQYLAPLRQRYQRLVGVHIRRGDYHQYRDGQWFFDHAVYRRIIIHLAGLFPGECVGFVIATNCPFPAEDFAGLEAHPAPGHLALDMYALAGCDLIVGPPSTFSGWASFFGQKPIYFLEDKDRLPERTDLDTIWTPRFY